MTETPPDAIILEPDGRIILPERVMADIVLETPGCALWQNEKDRAIGIRLLRGDDRPPHRIERRPGPGGGVRGLIEAGPFLAKIGLEPGGPTRRCSYQYFATYHMLAVSLGGPVRESGRPARGILDDMPALED